MMRALRGLWSSRPGGWIGIPVTMVLGAALWYIIVQRIGPAAAWQQCEEAYHRANSLRDSARVDELRPFVRREVSSLNCGLLRAERRGRPPLLSPVMLSYEPVKVQVPGVLDTLWRYGPPNFGESPGQDLRVQVVTMHLSHPINVRGDGADDPNSEEAMGVTLLQLVTKDHQFLRDSIGASVIAYGSLFHGHSGHHYTEVLMTLDSVRWSHPE